MADTADHPFANRAETDADWRATDGGIEIYDPGNPDAWVRMEFVAGVAPEKRLFWVCPACGSVAPQPTAPGGAAVCGDCGGEFVQER